MSWSLDMNLQESDSGYSTLQTLQKMPVLGQRRVAAIERQLHDRVGGGSRSNVTTSSTSEAIQRQKVISAKKQSKAMAIATNPAKQLAMNCFMLYMSGSNLSIWSMSATSTSIMTPLRSIFTIHSTFAPLEDDDRKVDLQLPKILYTLLNILWLGVGLYKMSSMRLLPTTSADWSGRILWKEMMEISSVPPV